MKHEVSLLKSLWLHVTEGSLRFIVRNNEYECWQAGDSVEFKFRHDSRHELGSRMARVTYVHTGYGMIDGKHAIIGFEMEN